LPVTILDNTILLQMVITNPFYAMIVRGLGKKDFADPIFLFWYVACYLWNIIFKIIAIVCTSYWQRLLALNALPALYSICSKSDIQKNMFPQKGSTKWSRPCAKHFWTRRNAHFVDNKLCFSYECIWIQFREIWQKLPGLMVTEDEPGVYTKIWIILLLC